MPTFTYTFIDPKGAKRTASVDSGSAQELERRLDGEGIVVLSIRRGAGGGDENSKEFGTKAPSRRKVQRRDLIEFAIFVGTLARAGLSVTVALKDFGEETSNPYFAYVTESICQGIEAGETMASGMARFPDVFAVEFTSMIKAGEKSGNLPSAFDEIRKYLEWQESLSGDIRQATTYPVVVSILLGCFVLYLFSFVVPKIAKILTDMHLKLPMITQIVLWLSNFATKTWWMWVIVGVSSPILFKLSKKQYPAFADFVDKVKINIPVFGVLNSMIAQARFAQNFAVLHRSGISILENLELCHELVGNRLFSKALSFAVRDVREGGTLSDSLRRSGLFSGLSLRMLAVGEMTGDLENSLINVSRYYNEELPRRVKRVFALLEPMLIVTLVGIVGVVALAIFLPILGMGGGLKR